MSRIFVVSLLTIALAGLCLADSHEKHAYQKAAAIHDLMEVMVKPSMDKIQAMSKQVVLRTRMNGRKRTALLPC